MSGRRVLAPCRILPPSAAPAKGDRPPGITIVPDIAARRGAAGPEPVR